MSYQDLPWSEKLKIAEAAKPGDVWIDNVRNIRVIVVGKDSPLITLKRCFDGDYYEMPIESLAIIGHPDQPVEEKPVSKIVLAFEFTEPKTVAALTAMIDYEILRHIQSNNTAPSGVKVERVRG